MVHNILLNEKIHDYHIHVNPIGKSVPCSAVYFIYMPVEEQCNINQDMQLFVFLSDNK